MDEGTMEYYRYKFKIYLSSVSRYMMNKHRKDIPYHG